MSSLSQEEFNKLVDNAIALCSKYDTASPYFLQRSLGIDLDTAFLVFEELVKESFLINMKSEKEYGEINYIADVNKEKLKELKTN